MVADRTSICEHNKPKYHTARNNLTFLILCMAQIRRGNGERKRARENIRGKGLLSCASTHQKAKLPESELYSQWLYVVAVVGRE